MKIIKESAESVVVSFGRFNPPTIGHLKLIKAMQKQSPGQKAKLYLSHSTDPEKNPLPYDRKVYWQTKAFGDLVDVVNSESRTIINVMNELYKAGYKKVIYVGGSDRIGGEDDITQSISKYNGQPNKKGEILYQFDEINYISAGPRDENSTDITEVASASLARRLAREQDLAGFSELVPFTDDDQKKLYYELRTDMGLVESLKEAAFQNGEISKHGYKYYDAVVNDLVGDGVQLDDGTVIKYDKEDKEQLKDKLLSLHGLDDKELVNQFNDSTGIKWNKIYKGKYSGYSAGNGVGMEQEKKVYENQAVQEVILAGVRNSETFKKRLGVKNIDNIIINRSERIGGQNNKRGVSLIDLFTRDDLYNQSSSGASTGQMIADVVYYVDIEADGLVIKDEPIYISVKEGNTTSPINLGLNKVPAEDIINQFTSGASKEEQTLIYKFLQLRGKLSDVCLAIKEHPEEEFKNIWVYHFRGQTINKENLKRGLINSFGANYFYAHLKGDSVDHIEYVSDITDRLQSSPITNCSLVVTQQRMVQGFSLGDYYCKLFLRRKGSPVMFLLSEFKLGAKESNYVGDIITDLTKQEYGYIKYK